MAELKDEDYFINLKLMKRSFFLNVFNPKDKNFLKWNVYRMTFFVFTVITQCVVLIGTYGYVFYTDYIITNVEIVTYMTVLFQNYLAIWKYIIFLYKGNEAWDILFDISRLNVFKSNSCCERLKIMYEYGEWVIKMTNIYFVVVSMICLQWMLCPLMLNLFTSPEIKNDRFLLNIFDFRFPISIDTYNQYYSIFYAIGSTVIFPMVYIVLYTDIYVISLSLIIISHCKVICRAFESIGHDEDTQIAGEYEEFKSILFDQQRLFLQLKSYYSVIKPIMLGCIAFNSGSSISTIYVVISYCMSAESISFIDTTRLLSAGLLYSTQIFFYCYLFENINQEIESVNFSIYSCNWTKMDLKFKKLLLLAMRINNVNRLVLRASPKKIVNLQLFSSVMTTNYNILSVMLKTASNKNELAK